jgi:predicted acyl esterase
MSNDNSGQYRFRAPLCTPESRGRSAPEYRRTVEHGMIIERDVAVPLRDGVEIFVDVFRPQNESPAAPLIGWSPYGKHVLGYLAKAYPNSGVRPEYTSAYTAFEAPDPLYWVPRGYAVINADIRGTWYSRGDARYCAPEEAQDFYDLIEWAGTQRWSNGRVGLSGVSYLTVMQWRVAETHRYEAVGSGRAQFTLTFTEPTELIGHMKVRLFVAAEGADDMDLFAAIQKLDSKGSLVPFAYYAQFEDGPVALGWLRVSHRELDETRSTEFQPVLAHQRELKLAPGHIVPVDIEIWPSGTRFEAGEKLRLVVQGSDVYRYPEPLVYARHESTVNAGRHVIHTGGETGSYLLVPHVPEQPVR